MWLSVSNDVCSDTQQDGAKPRLDFLIHIFGGFWGEDQGVADIILLLNLSESVTAQLNK